MEMNREKLFDQTPGLIEEIDLSFWILCDTLNEVLQLKRSVKGSKRCILKNFTNISGYILGHFVKLLGKKACWALRYNIFRTWAQSSHRY